MSRRTFNPVFWAMAQIGSRLRVNVSPALDITTVDLPGPETIHIRTRHGDVRTLVFRPREIIPAAPVVMHLHGGGFINRHPEQDRHIARFLVAELGATVMLPDYDTAPKVRYPVAEEEMADVARWIQEFHGDRLFLSGVSAGAKLAINVCQQLHTGGATRPLAVALTVPVTDIARTDRTSAVPRPAISPWVQRSVAWNYFPDAERRREALASPRYDPSLAGCMPPTLIQAAEHDTLAPEGAELAGVLRAAGVEVVHHVYPGVDHGFPAEKPVATVREMLTETAEFFRKRL